MKTVNNSYNVNFTSLKPQKRLGEKVLREFQNEMGYLESSSSLVVRIRNNEKRLNPASMNKWRAKQDKLLIQIYDSFLSSKLGVNSFETFSDFKDVLVSNIKSKGNKANCWENMMIVSAKLLEKGEKPQNFGMKFTSANGRKGNHFSTVIGLRPDAVISKPKTWGSKALVVDAWAKVVKPASEALEEIKIRLFNGDKVIAESYEPFVADFVEQGQL